MTNDLTRPKRHFNAVLDNSDVLAPAPRANFINELLTQDTRRVRDEYMSLTREGGSRTILRKDRGEIRNSGLMVLPAESRAG